MIMRSSTKAGLSKNDHLWVPSRFALELRDAAAWLDADSFTINGAPGSPGRPASRQKITLDRRCAVFSSSVHVRPGEMKNHGSGAR